jgi:hypothetical protein
MAMRGGMKPHTLLALTLGVAQVARADVPDPAVHTPAARLDQARATVYKQKALDLRVASPQLLSSNTGRADPPAPQAWRIVHPKGHEVSVENVAAKLHRTRELEEFPREIDTTAAWVGVWMLVAAASVGSTVPILLATNSKQDNIEAVGATAGVTGGAGLITLIIGAVLHSTSDHEVPLSVATNMVREYNEGLALELGAAAAPADAIAAPAMAAGRERASPAVAVVGELSASSPRAAAVDQSSASRAAPSVRLGVRLFESDGVRITAVVDAAASALRAGDLVLSIDDIPLPTLAALRSYTSRLRPGDTVKVRVRRSGVELDVALHL